MIGLIVTERCGRVKKSCGNYSGSALKFNDWKNSSLNWNIFNGVIPWRIISSVTSAELFPGKGAVNFAI